MKEELLLNDSYFNYEKLRLNESKFRIATGNEEFILSKCLEARDSKHTIGIIAEPGYGVHTSFLKYAHDYRAKSTYYLLEPKKGENFQTWLAHIIQMDIPAKIAKFHTAKATHLINSITHLFKDEPNKQRLIIIYNIQNLNESGLASFGLLIKSLKDICGVIFSIDPTTYNKLQDKADKVTYIRDILTDVKQRFELSPPTPKELGNLCIQRGIHARKVIDELLKKASDFKMLDVEIEVVKTLLKDKGRL